jgi:hypothetical protein
MDKRWMGWMLSLGALSCVAGCGPADEGEEAAVGDVEVAEVGEAEQAISANPGLCQNGMSTKLKKLHAPSDFGPQGQISAWFTCTLDEVPDYVNYVCATDQKVCDFLLDVVDGHGLLQCKKWVEDGKKRTCVDVVDKDPAGNLLEGKPQTNYIKNFNVFMHDDNAGSPDVGYWDTQLPLFPDPPIELEPTGYYFMSQVAGNLVFDRNPPTSTAPVRRVRAFRFDPQDCAGCGQYAGPNYDQLTNLGISQLDVWFPEFNALNCRFYKQQGLVSFTVLSQTRCNQEATYRNTGR